MVESLNRRMESPVLEVENLAALVEKLKSAGLKFRMKLLPDGRTTILLDDRTECERTIPARLKAMLNPIALYFGKRLAAVQFIRAIAYLTRKYSPERFTAKPKVHEVLPVVRCYYFQYPYQRGFLPGAINKTYF